LVAARYEARVVGEKDGLSIPDVVPGWMLSARVLFVQ
jgi:hypothetical protein